MLDPPPLEACFCAVDYSFPWAGLIARFKFQQQPGLARQLACLLQGVDGLAKQVAQTDIVVPMPLTTERLRQRGYNQALLLARHLCKNRTEPYLLQRVREAPPQNQLNRSERVRNVRGVFAVAAAHQQRVRNASVLLVDDVMTTGASLYSAAQCLHDAGARRVTAVVIARTPE